MHISILYGPAERTVPLIKSTFYGFILALASLALLSCAQPRSADSWDPLQPPASPDAVREPATEAAPASGLSRSTDQLSAPVADLIGRADDAIQQQHWAEASALLERALRINPKQAEAWTRMAVVNLGSNHPQQSIQMAQKSNRHAGASRSLMAYNWLLISRAYEQLGLSDKARQALDKSRRLQDGNE